MTSGSTTVISPCVHTHTCYRTVDGSCLDTSIVFSTFVFAELQHAEMLTVMKQEPNVSDSTCLMFGLRLFSFFGDSFQSFSFFSVTRLIFVTFFPSQIFSFAHFPSFQNSFLSFNLYFFLSLTCIHPTSSLSLSPICRLAYTFNRYTCPHTHTHSSQRLHYSTTGTICWSEWNAAHLHMISMSLMEHYAE